MRRYKLLVFVVMAGLMGSIFSGIPTPANAAPGCPSVTHEFTYRKKSNAITVNLCTGTSDNLLGVFWSELEVPSFFDSCRAFKESVGPFDGFRGEAEGGFDVKIAEMAPVAGKGKDKKNKFTIRLEVVGDSNTTKVELPSWPDTSGEQAGQIEDYLGALKRHEANHQRLGAHTYRMVWELLVPGLEVELKGKNRAEILEDLQKQLGDIDAVAETAQRSVNAQYDSLAQHGLNESAVTGGDNTDADEYIGCRRTTPYQFLSARSLFDTGPLTPVESATSVAGSTQTLTVGDGDKVLLSSTPDGTGPFAADNYIWINSVPDFLCEDFNRTAGRSCYGPVIDPNWPVGASIGSVVELIGPIDVSDRIPVGTSSIRLDVTDHGGRSGWTSLYLVVVSDID